MQRRLAIAMVGILGAAGGGGLSGCGPAPRTTDYPSLDPDPDPRTVVAGTEGGEGGGAVVIPAAPPPDLAEFTPPLSQPTGEPVVIRWRPPAVGTTRTRVVEHQALYTTVWKDDARHQRTVQRFEVVERIARVKGDEITALEVTVNDGTEVVELDGPPRSQTLLSGDYLVEVDAGADGRLMVSRGGTGFSMGDREREELVGLYGGEVGTVTPLEVVLRGLKLRAGEVLTLDEATRTVLGGGTPIEQQVSLWLRPVTAGVATFEIMFFDHEETPGDAANPDVPTTDTRGVKLALAIEIATGRIVRMSWLDARGDQSTSSQSTSRSATEATIKY